MKAVIAKGLWLACGLLNDGPGNFFWEGKPMLSSNFARTRLGLAAAAFSVLLLPSGAFATSMSIDWTTDNSVGTLVNQTQLQIRVACSGNGTICSAAGLMSAYESNLATSELTGTANSVADDVLQTLSFDSLNASGTDVLFTMLSTVIQPGGTALISDILVTALNSVSSALAGFTIDQSDAQALNVTFNGMDWAVSATTNVGAIGNLALSPGPIINAQGTFAEVGTNSAPEFELRNLRGSFQLLTGTVLSGANVAITFRATFTLNLKGIAAAIPEPGTFALLGGGLLAFGAAAVRRRS